MLTMICLTAAILLNEDVRSRLQAVTDQVAERAADEGHSPVIATRIAPASPEPSSTVPTTVVRLGSIEIDLDAPRIARPAPPADEVRFAEEKPANVPQPSSTTQAARQPLRAALHLGEQAIRAIRR